MEVEGDDLVKLKSETGGVRLQRVPPTERKGRIHTSTVTVVVYDVNIIRPVSEINDSDLKVEWFSGSGAGGQNRNKVQNCCRLTHIPTGIVKISQQRDRRTSYDTAKKALSNELKQQTQFQTEITLRNTRKEKGCGMRGDKIRTFRFQDNVAIDHRTHKKVSLSKVMSGDIDLLW